MLPTRSNRSGDTAAEGEKPITHKSVKQTYSDDSDEDRNLLPNDLGPQPDATLIRDPMKNNVPSFYRPCDNLERQIYPSKGPIVLVPPKRKSALDNAMAPRSTYRRPERVSVGDEGGKLRERSGTAGDVNVSGMGKIAQRDAEHSRYFPRQSKPATRSTSPKLTSPRAGNGIRNSSNDSSKPIPNISTEILPVNRRTKASNLPPKPRQDDSDDDLEITGRPMKLTHRHPLEDSDDLIPTKWEGDELTPTEEVLNKHRSTQPRSPAWATKARSAADGSITLDLKGFVRGNRSWEGQDAPGDLTLTIDIDGDFQLTHKNKSVQEAAFQKNDVKVLQVSKDGNEVAITLTDKRPRRNEHPKNNLVYFHIRRYPSQVQKMFQGVKLVEKEDKFFTSFQRTMRLVDPGPSAESHPSPGRSLRQIGRSVKNFHSKPLSTKGVVPVKRSMDEVAPEDWYGKPIRDSKQVKRTTRASTVSESRTTRQWLGEVTSSTLPWKTPLIYPPTGKSRATVDHIDLDRLNDGEFLNDNIINFYLKWLEVKLNQNKPELGKKFHFFNTFFFGNLSRRTADRKRDFSRVMKWTAGVDLFEKHFIFVPINENTHWYLAIICNLQHVGEKIARRQGGVGSKDAVPGAESGHEETARGIQDPRTIATGIDSDSKKNQEAEKSSKQDALPQDIREAQLLLADDAEASFERMSIDEDRGSRELEEHAEDVVEISESNCVPGTGLGIDSDTQSPMPTSKTKASTQKPKKAPKPYEPDSPAIFILDSLNTRGHGSTFTVLREYLREEAKNKKQMEVSATKEAIIGAYPTVPEQPNFCDCGLYLLYYVEEFIDRPEKFAEEFLRREKNLFDETDVRPMRMKLRQLIIRLKVEQDALEPAAAEKGTFQEDADDDLVEIVENKRSEDKPETDREEEAEGSLTDPMQVVEQDSTMEEPRAIISKERLVDDDLMEITDSAPLQALNLRGIFKGDRAGRERSTSVSSRPPSRLRVKQGSRLSPAVSSSPPVSPPVRHAVHEVLDIRSPSPESGTEYEVPKEQPKANALFEGGEHIQISDDEIESISEDPPSSPRRKYQPCRHGRRRPNSRDTSIEPSEEIDDWGLQLKIQRDVQQEQQRPSVDKPLTPPHKGNLRPRRPVNEERWSRTPATCISNTEPKGNDSSLDPSGEQRIDSSLWD